MIWMVDPADGTPLYEQVAGCVHEALLTGELSPGDKLPPARQLAASLDINMHTVLRAYQSLRDSGLLELRRGRGAVVRRQLGATPQILEQIDALLGSARTLGLPVEALVTLVRGRGRPAGAGA